MPLFRAFGMILNARDKSELITVEFSTLTGIIFGVIEPFFHRKKLYRKTNERIARA